MLVYQPGTVGRRSLITQPGKKYPVSHFLDEVGEPKTFVVVFTNGQAEVDDPLGQYLIDRGEAAASPILLPFGATP